MLINRVGYLIFTNIEMIVANRFLSLSVAGMYGALLTIPSNLITVANTVSGVWGPLILSKYSRDDYSGIDRVAKTSIKLIGLSIALPVGFVSGVSGEFLGFWLGPEFTAYKWVAAVMAFFVLINSLTSPLFGIYISMNKVEIPAIVTALTGVMYFIFSVLFVKRFGPMGLAAAGGLVLAVRNVFFITIYSAFLLKKKWWHYLRDLLHAPIITIIVALLSYGFVHLFRVKNIFELLIVGGGISVVYLIGAYFLGLSQKEKELIIGSIIRNKT